MFFSSISTIIRNMETEIIPAYDHIEDIRQLFLEYNTFLLEGSTEKIRECLAIQHYDEELDDPARKYLQPQGRLFIALTDGCSSGCIAFRRLDNETAELKRFFVRQEYRKAGIGRLLIEKAIAEAGKAGYSRILLDTLPSLQGAIHLYRKYGFSECARYNDNPIEEAVFMELKLY